MMLSVVMLTNGYVMLYVTVAPPMLEVYYLGGVTSYTQRANTTITWRKNKTASS